MENGRLDANQNEARGGQELPAAENRIMEYLKYQGDWLEKTRGNLMVVATVIATMSFQVAVNPPGGVWQEPDKLCGQNQTCEAGTSIVAYSKETTYDILIGCSTVSFSASLSIILLLVSGLRLRQKFVMWVLILFMVVAVLFMAATYMISLILVRAPADGLVVSIAFCYVCYWVGLVALLITIQFILSLVWLLKKTVPCMIRVICCRCWCRQPTHRDTQVRQRAGVA